VIITILFWMGVIGAVREWHYARKHGPPVTRSDKWCLVVAAVVLPLVVRLNLEWFGVAPRTVTLAFQGSVAAGVNAWALWRLIRRTSARGSPRPGRVSSRAKGA
jgi:hypothetical protein